MLLCRTTSLRRLPPVAVRAIVLVLNRVDCGRHDTPPRPAPAQELVRLLLPFCSLGPPQTLTFVDVVRGAVHRGSNHRYTPITTFVLCTHHFQFWPPTPSSSVRSSAFQTRLPWFLSTAIRHIPRTRLSVPFPQRGINILTCQSFPSWPIPALPYYCCT